MISRISNDKQWLILIHGLGVSEKCWSLPLEEKVKFISFRTLLKQEKETASFVDRCGGQYNIASWTQQPYGNIGDAAAELRDLIGKIECRDFVFIAHSRGGLVARYAIQKHGLKPGALICLATPHYGSRLANHVIKNMTLIRLIIPSIANNRASIDELRTDAGFILDINKPEGCELEKQIPHFDICGNSPRFFDLGPLNIFGSLQPVFGERLIDEWKKGTGDGFVSVSSARSPLTPENDFHLLPLNHANILINGDAFDIVSGILATLAKRSL